MSYLQTSIVSVLGYLNAANKTKFTEADVTFGTPSPTDGTWQGLNTTKNTAVNILAVKNGNYDGSKAIVYDRLKLNDLINIPGFRIFADRPKTVYDILDSLRYYTGVYLQQSDVENTAVVDKGDGTYTTTLTAKATSLGWIGSLAVTIKQGGARLDKSIVDTELSGLNYPTASDQDTYGQIYLYPYDFTSYYDTIDPLVAGATLTSAQADSLVTMLKAVDLSSGKTLWNNTANSTTWSLSGAKVIANDLNGADLPTNPAYKYVLVLKLRDDVTTPKGNLYLHYNDPVDPNAV